MHWLHHDLQHCSPTCMFSTWMAWKLTHHIHHFSPEFLWTQGALSWYETWLLYQSRGLHYISGRRGAFYGQFLSDGVMEHIYIICYKAQFSVRSILDSFHMTKKNSTNSLTNRCLQTTQHSLKSYSLIKN